MLENIDAVWCFSQACYISEHTHTHRKDFDQILPGMVLNHIHQVWINTGVKGVRIVWQDLFSNI